MPACFDGGLEFFSLGMAGLDPEERIEVGIQFARVVSQCAVGQIWPTPGDAAGALEEFVKPRCEGRIAGIDCVFGIADKMGEAELMVALGPPHLSTEPIGYPEVRAAVAEEFRHHDLAAVTTSVRLSLEQIQLVRGYRH